MILSGLIKSSFCKNSFVIYICFLIVVDISIAGITGKIIGRIIDSNTGEPIVGANLLIKDTFVGSSSDNNGYYVIINISPGFYDVECSIIGYKDYTVRDVRVEIDQTTTLDFNIELEIIEGETVIVDAIMKVIRKDVAATHFSINSQTIEELPIGSINEILAFHAGITKELGVRGGRSDQTMFMVDGVVIKQERNNLPITALPLSAVREISVQTGGFSAEYNNVRSGVVNVVTKEGHPKNYSGTLSIRQSSASPKHFGISPYDRNSFWLRPYLDQDVCWTGTDNGQWDEYTQRQYPSFEGWNSVSEASLSDDNPENDITPAAAKQIYMWEHRKKGYIQKPDQNIDLGFGGPIPFIGQYLGNLRFFFSYRTVQDMYLMQLSHDGLYDSSSLLKITSDISKTMKFSILGLYNQIQATTSSRSGGTSYMNDVFDVASEIDRKGFTVPWRIYTNTYWSQTSSNYDLISAKFSHLVNPRTMYDLQLRKFTLKYNTGPSRHRDNTKQYEIFSGYFVDEAPFGFEEDPIFGIDGMGMGGSVSTSRDSSKFITYSLKFDFTNQLNLTNHIKTGIELIYDSFDMKYGMVNKALPEGNFFNISNGNPFRISGYFQDKMEYEGFIPILGIVIDYIDPNDNWYQVESFSREFFSSNYNDANEDIFKNEKAKHKLYLSPRLSISHPITVNSKFYYNYGHYRQIPSNENMYRVQRSSINQLDYLGDPMLPLSRTISYELGYDHSFNDNYLLHLSAYYKNIDSQEDWTQYISVDGKVNYNKLTADSYEDIRGFEFYISKLYGKWLTGHLNYEYRVGTNGYFGVKKIFENPSDQREYLRLNPYQEKPRPRPRFKANINFHTPNEFGPYIFNSRPFGGWLFNLIGEWTTGYWFTWNPNNIPGISYNVQWSDQNKLNLKISKKFQFETVRIQFYTDIFNLFNIKYLSGESFYDMDDYNYYFYSLHLSDEIASNLGDSGSPYPNIPGDDQPGDYREEGIEFIPMEWVTKIQNVVNPSERPIYYDASINSYYQWNSTSGWLAADNQYLQYSLDNKAYIDMPNQSFFSFLNPRDIFLGMTIYFDIK